MMIVKVSRKIIEDLVFRFDSEVAMNNHNESMENQGYIKINKWHEAVDDDIWTFVEYEREVE